MAGVRKKQHLRAELLPAARSYLDSLEGRLYADLRQDFVMTSVCPVDRVDPLEFETLFAEMEAEAVDLMREQSMPQERIAFRRLADMRYAGQEHTVKVPMIGSPIAERDITEIKESFHRLHERAYGLRLDSRIEPANYHLTALGVPGFPGTLSYALKAVLGKYLRPPCGRMC